MTKIVGNLKELIDDSAAGYINLNVDKFKSTTPGPVGPTGPIGPQGEGVHHMKGTSTTDPEGDFSTAGELDTYTFYADADELFPLAWFTVKNGEDPWLRAVDRGYRGTEEEFYAMMGSIEEYATIALESINITEKNKQFVIEQAQIVAADKLIVEQNMNTTISNREQTDLVLVYINSILLGNKDADPLVDNNGDTLTIGSIYFNTVENTLKVWSGIKWFALTFTFNGRAGEVVLLNSDVTSAVGRDVADALNNIDIVIANEVSKTNTHIVNISNPHNVTKDQVGLGNVDNTEDSVKNVLSAQETVVLVRNGTGVSIPDGTVVMLTGSIGNSGRLVVAPYDGVSDASLILGVATETIASNADGFVTSYGKIRGIDTSMWSDGDVLYVNSGGLSLTPTNSLSMKIAAVVHSHTNGTLMIRVNGYSQVKEW